MKLVIVESPKKCETIGGYLGGEYHVMASKGHLRELATCGKGGLGIDVTGDFAPTYVIANGKQKTVYEIKKEAIKAKEVIIATDPDREGEAIGWHLTQLLGLDPKETKRLEFHEITRTSILEAIKSPRTLDMNLVASQETRRIFDRIIGFKLSALMNKKINSPSAGRVQSATLKLICDLQLEIDQFVPEEYWTLSLDLSNGKNDKFTVSLDKIDGKKPSIPNKEINDEIVARLQNSNVKLVSISKKERVVESKPPFTTSTMQQEAFNVYKFSTSKTSSLAQKLYEGIVIGSDHIGLVTYIRTDSMKLSNTFIQHAKAYINEQYGSNYIGKVRAFKDGEHSQEAHEAIRPTSNHRTPESIRQYLTPDEYKLYKLIYERAVASLMAPKIEEVTTATFEINGLTFKVDGVHTLFDGYEKINPHRGEEKQLPSLSKDDIYVIENINNKQEFTKAPQQYSEAKLVKTMEELGIGRPSTYAATIKKLYERKYVESKGGFLVPTDQGMRTSRVLTKFFPEFVDSKFTAKMEKDLDEVQDGNESRTEMVKNFYFEFSDQVKKMGDLMYNDPEEETGTYCPKCGSPLVIKKSRHGKFIACSSFPTCDYIQKEAKDVKYTGEKCPLCGMPLVERKDKRGKKFVGCSGFPHCSYIKGTQTNKDPAPRFVKRCPKCNGYLIIKKGKYSDFLGCTNYPKCRYQEKIENKEGD